MTFGRSRKIGDLAALVGWPLLDAFQIWIGIVANADVVCDGPLQACGQQDVGATEAITHQISPAIGQRGFDMAQLTAEIFPRPRYDVWRRAIDVSQGIGLVTTHHI